MTADSFTVALLSGRFDAPTGPLRDWLDKHRPDVAGHTEVNTRTRANEIWAADRYLTWDHRRPGHTRGNCAVSHVPFSPLHGGGFVGLAVDLSLADDDSFRCTPLTYQRQGGAEVQIWAPIVVLEFPNGRRVLFSTAHFPATVEGPSGWRGRSRRVLVHWSAARGWRKETRRLARKHGAQRVLMADFNINQERRFARRWYRATFPGLRGAEYARQGRLRPTHGRRVIDRIMHSRGLRPTAYTTHPELPGYDHAPITVTFTWDKARRWGRRTR